MLTKEIVLQRLYKMKVFDLKGNFVETPAQEVAGLFSCLICACRSPELNELLHDLYAQSISKDRFEVIVVNDGAGAGVRDVVDSFRALLNIRYLELAEPLRIIGALRNKALELASGEYILFLDDDTRLLDKEFLLLADGYLRNGLDVLCPSGHALYGLVKYKYDYFNEFSFTNCCCFIRRSILLRLGGLRNDLIAYEDIDLGIRMTIIGIKVKNCPDLLYWHPPFYFYSWQKPIVMGQSILRLKNHYPVYIWLLIYLNSLRFLPFCLLPNRKCWQWFKISYGALVAPFIGKKLYY